MDDETQLIDPTAARAADSAAVWEQTRLPPEAAAHLARLRISLMQCRSPARAAARPRDLDRAFAAASAIACAVSPAAEAPGRPDLEQLRSLARAVPEFGEFLSLAADEAQRAVAGAVGALWSDLGLAAPAPGWDAAEREAARMVFACACACAPRQASDADRLRAGLRSVAAGRFARRLAAELAADEQAWVRALGERYASVRHRCAPRTARRSRGLSELLDEDEISRLAVVTRLERWMCAGGSRSMLAAELEAGLVHVRTPSKFA